MRSHLTEFTSFLSRRRGILGIRRRLILHPLQLDVVDADEVAGFGLRVGACDLNPQGVLARGEVVRAQADLGARQHPE